MIKIALASKYVIVILAKFTLHIQFEKWYSKEVI